MPEALFAQAHDELVRGRLESAMKDAAAGKERYQRSDAAWSLRFCLLQADVYAMQGASRNVVRLLDGCGAGYVPGADAAPGADEVIKRSTLLGLAYARMGDAKRSNEELEKARALATATNSLLRAEVFRTYGLLEHRARHLAESEAYLRTSLELGRQQHDLYQQTSDLLNLGTVAAEAERFDEALGMFKASSQIANSIHAELIQQTDLGNAGWAAYSLGNFDEALATFEQATERARAAGARDFETLWLQDTGVVYYRLGDLAQAQNYYQEALRAAKEGQNIASQAATEALLGQLLLQLNQTDAAKVRADEALRLARQVGARSIELDASLLEGLIAVQQSKSVATEQLLMRVWREAVDAPSTRWEAESALADLAAERGAMGQADAWHRRAIATFEAQRASVLDVQSRLPFFVNGDGLYRGYAEFLIAQHRPDEALRVLDGARARTLKEGLGQSSQGRQDGRGPAVSPMAIAQRQRATILFYSLGPQRSYLWAIRAKGVRLFTLPPEEEIAARVKSYQAAILRSRDPLRERNADAQWLYAALIAPAEALVPRSGRVLVVPTGSLNGLNMETLLKPGPGGPHYWIEDVSVTTASSIQLLSSSPRAAEGNVTSSSSSTSAGRGRLLLLGDTVAPASGYAALPNASAEVEKVQRWFAGDGRTVLTHGAAVPAAYAASRPEEYAYIHFVAHGVASSLQPLDSAIVLSPAGGPGGGGDQESFKLYARDIVRRPLHARLVTISACYGSGLRNYAGEGLVGLSWAFLRAGAHHVIGAMWEVNDSSTPQMMDLLYKELAAGEEPSEALRTAKLSLLHSQGVYRKPLYWGAFQLYAGS